jgi:hypothetical protein
MACKLQYLYGGAGTPVALQQPAASTRLVCAVGGQLRPWCKLRHLFGAFEQCSSRLLCRHAGHVVTVAGVMPQAALC